MVTKQTPILKHKPCMAFKMETSTLVSIVVVPWLFQQVSAKYLLYFVRILSNAWWEIGKPKVAKNTLTSTFKKVTSEERNLALQHEIDLLHECIVLYKTSLKDEEK